MIRRCESGQAHVPHDWILGRYGDQVHCPGRWNSLNGWTICPEPEFGGLWVVRDPSGVKRGMTQTEAGAKIIRRRKAVSS